MQQRNAVAQNPDDGWLWQRYASVLAANGFANEARVAYAQAWNLTQSRSAHFLLAYTFRNDPVLALTRLADGGFDAHTAETHYFAAQMLRQSGRLDEALIRYEAAIEETPAVVQMHMEALETALELNEVAPAERHLTTLLMLGPDQEGVQFQARRFAQIFGRTIEAGTSQTLNDAKPVALMLPMIRQMESNTRTQAGLRALGRRAVGEGDWRGTVRWYQLLKSAYPLNATDNFNLGVGLTALGQLDQALTNLKEAELLDNKNPDVALAMARVYLMQNQGAQAEAKYQQVLASAPQYQFHALQGIGRAKASGGALSEAKNWLERAAGVADASPHIYEDLARVSADLGQLDETRKFVARAEALGFAVSPQLKRFIQ